MEITNEIKAKVRAGYLMQPVAVCNPDYAVRPIVPDLLTTDLLWHSNMKLALSPLSEITDEDAVGVKNLLRAANSVWEIDEYTTKDIAQWLLKKGRYMYSHCFQYLQSKGYDLPHYLLGGKTLHEAGLAIYEK